MYTFTDDESDTFALKSFTVTASDITTGIAFTGYNNPSAFRLDNVVVSANAVTVPEAGTFALVGVGFSVLGVGIVRRKRAA